MQAESKSPSQAVAGKSAIGLPSPSAALTSNPAQSQNTGMLVRFKAKIIWLR